MWLSQWAVIERRVPQARQVVSGREAGYQVISRPLHGLRIAVGLIHDKEVVSKVSLQAKGANVIA